MTQVELIEAIADTTGFKKLTISIVLDELLKEVTYCFQHNEAVKLRGYATLFSKKLKPKKVFGKEAKTRHVLRMKMGRKSPWKS